MLTGLGGIEPVLRSTYFYWVRWNMDVAELCLGMKVV